MYKNSRSNHTPAYFYTINYCADTVSTIVFRLLPKLSNRFFNILILTAKLIIGFSCTAAASASLHVFKLVKISTIGA